MSQTWLLLLCLFFALVHSDTPQERPTVTTPLGKIRGQIKKSAKRNKFVAFEGIPYAKPPIGERRFEPAEPVEPWEGTWDAVSLTQCAQTGLFTSAGPQGDEDCLYVNVYVPRETPNPTERLDVIVHIHGGFFMFGSAHAYSHPEYFMDEDVIFVTFNYRLGIFGFLSTADNVVPGNSGLKDQVLALKWVQQNIASFGGNPESVTLTGMSSGASSVHFHYLSDMSRGLFHRGFSQSGVSLNSFALQDNPLGKAKHLGELVGCPTSTTFALVKCLKQRPAVHLLSRVPLFFGYAFLPVAPFAPVLEKGPKPFLNKNPYFLLAKGKTQNLPWLVSTVSHEGFFPASFLHSDLAYINENWTDVAPSLLDFNDTLATPWWKNAANTIREYYFGEDQDINEESFTRFVQMFSDRFLVDVDAAVKLQAKFSKAPVYYYQFGYASDSSANKTVSHGDDAQYFFYNIHRRQPTPDELKMKEILMRVLLTFAKTGKPVIDDVAWEPVKFPEITLANITGFETKDIKVETVKNLAPREFWQSLGFLENQNLVLMKDEL